MRDIEVIDYALTYGQTELIRKTYPALNAHTTKLFSHSDIKMFHPLIDICSKYFDLSTCFGYELWDHKDTRPDGWHVDKDEILYKEGINKYPLCSIIYYLDINIYHKGKLLINTGKKQERITPKTNRLVLLGPRIPHCVEKFWGTREVIIINPWDRKLGNGKG